MGEGFSAKPEHIAGYGLLVEDVREQVKTIKSYVEQHGGAKSGFTGLILEMVKPPVDAYATATGGRLDDQWSMLDSCGTELRRAAWDYSEFDVNEAKIYHDDGQSNPTVPARVEGYEKFPESESYPPGSDPAADLSPPEIAEANIKSMVEEVGGSLQAIEWIVSKVTGWSPVGAITEPITGNWNALAAAGEALINTGDAIEGSLGNLTKSLPTLDPHWNGGAAQAFTEHITGLVTGGSQEGPLNRIVGEVYGLVASKIEQVAEYVVTTLKSVVDQIGERIATGWIPFIGWARVIEFIWDCVGIFNEAKAMVDELQTMAENLQQLVNIAKDPVGELQAGIEGKLAPIKETAGDVEHGFDIAKDMAAIGNKEAWEATPDDPYATNTGGADPRRNG